MESKICRVCETENPITEYHFRKDNGTYRNECKKCISLKGKRYLKENHEAIRERQKEYRSKNLEKLTISNRNWRQNNPQKFSPTRKKWREENKERIKKQRAAFYQENKERIDQKKNEHYKNNFEHYKKRKKDYAIQNKVHLLGKRREWERDKLKNDPVYKLAKGVRGRIRCALKKGCNGIRTQYLIGCSVPELKIHLEKQFKPGMTWENHGEWHIDHRIPVSWYNLLHEPCLKAAFNYTNLQPLWAKDNYLKNNKRADVLSH